MHTSSSSHLRSSSRVILFLQLPSSIITQSSEEERAYKTSAFNVKHFPVYQTDHQAVNQYTSSPTSHMASNSSDKTLIQFYSMTDNVRALQKQCLAMLSL